MVSPNTSWITGEWETQNISHLQELNEFSAVGLKVYVIYLMNNLCTNSVQNRHMPVKNPISVLSKPFGCNGIQGHFFPTLSFLALNPLLPPPNCFCPTPPPPKRWELTIYCQLIAALYTSPHSAILGPPANLRLLNSSSQEQMPFAPTILENYSCAKPQWDYSK